jgi:hypothetical protein
LQEGESGGEVMANKYIIGDYEINYGPENVFDGVAINKELATINKEIIDDAALGKGRTRGGEVMGWEDIAPEVPMWKSEPECKNCKKLKEMYADSCSESDSLLLDLERERKSVNELSLYCQKLERQIKVLERK